jgi:hypothetical protein
MRFSILSGAYKNAGDFLIVQRCKELLAYVYPDCEFIEYERRKDLSDSLDEINKSDCLILAGGPAYVSDIYPKRIPLTDNLNRIKAPIFSMALGWKEFGNPNIKYQYLFDEKTMELWHRIENDGFALGCRDWNSVEVLHRAGIRRTTMTGCAAWYDFDFVKTTTLQSDLGYKKICVSDPGRTANYDSAITLVKHLKAKFPHAEIQFVFHRGIGADANTGKNAGAALEKLTKYLKDIGINYMDISYSADGFSIYDTCDLHIGFRVHAHIYSLSKRRASVLIEEDLRGAGINQAVGLPSIKAMKDNVQRTKNKYVKKILMRNSNICNPNLLDDIDACLRYYEQTSGKPLEWAFERMQYYFDVMIEHIQSIKL